MDQESAEFVHSKTSSDLIANKLPKDFSKKLLGQFGFNGSTGGYEMSNRGECQDFCVWGGYSRGSPTRLPFVVRPAWAISTG